MRHGHRSPSIAAADRAVISDPIRIEMAILRSARAIRRAFNASLAPLGLTLTEASLLSFVRKHGPLSQRELADLLQISRPAAGTVIDGLERRSLIERRADPTDRRVWLIALTDAAEASARAFDEIDRALRESLRRDVTPAQRRALADVLATIENNAEAVAADAG